MHRLPAMIAVEVCDAFMRSNCTQRFSEGFIVSPPTLKNCKWCPQACPDSREAIFFAVTIRLRSSVCPVKCCIPRKLPH